MWVKTNHFIFAVYISIITKLSVVENFLRQATEAMIVCPVCPPPFNWLRHLLD